MQFFVGGDHIDHQVAEHFAGFNHQPGGKHIEHQFLRRACFHPRRTGDHFSPNHRRNSKLSGGGNGAPGLQEIPTVRQPSWRAYSSPAITYGVRPLAAMPTTTSCAVNPMFSNH